MIDIKHLINYLPFYYKEADTYKDYNGKGLLEHLLEICGTYFTNSIKIPIDNALDNLDISLSQFKNLIWSMLGKIPQGTSVQEDPLQLSSVQQENLLRYTNALYHIRGTKTFFESLFNIYNNEDNDLTLVSIVDSEANPKDYWLPDYRKILADPSNVDTSLKSYMDDSYSKFDTSTYDTFSKIKPTASVTFTFQVGIGNTSFRDSEEYRESLFKFIANVVDKYIPIYVEPVILVQNIALDPENLGTTKVIVYNITDYIPFSTELLDKEIYLDISYKEESYNKEEPWFSDPVHIGFNPDYNPEQPLINHEYIFSDNNVYYYIQGSPHKYIIDEYDPIVKPGSNDPIYGWFLQLPNVDENYNYNILHFYLEFKSQRENSGIVGKDLYVALIRDDSVYNSYGATESSYYFSEFVRYTDEAEITLDADDLRLIPKDLDIDIPEYLDMYRSYGNNYKLEIVYKYQGILVRKYIKFRIYPTI